ncbi:NADPH:quinone reductase-like Zn-dependent oxidoreductase [Actinomadura pelletieri DSM 43383]|uniref:NADPH:quinone reductase-like Zn-dependent oxidoreductase n=1 Tax=Actinomadura pelletieri DSM 43383 TaxID=1120940 RepID=A0A495QYQ0_9ACTN|nr:NADP-dependent oxidoreductase [Actinomadura pelletieri]RKS79187.1 NADPH:quinone reductase-like Zn-dependent oxidoreductase [Actinomadura pelletieri DSM 43383]
MRAIIVKAFGGPEALEEVEVPEPVPGPGQVRIRVAAAAVNPVDVAVRTGALADVGVMPALGARPAVGLGLDVAGTVLELGPDVVRRDRAPLAPGDDVIGIQDRPDVPLGTYAESIVLDAGAVVRAPRSVSLAEASTLPLNGLTALQALNLLDLPPRSTLLVTGAAGAVGGYTVELAALRGLRVVGSAAAADEAAVRGFGAEMFVPRDVHLTDAVRDLVPGGVDGAMDAAALSTAALGAVRNGGTFVVVGGTRATPPPLRGISVRNQWIRADAGQLGHLADLVDEGRLTLRVAETLPLTEAAKAHTRMEAGGLRGRLILIP